MTTDKSLFFFFEFSYEKSNDFQLCSQNTHKISKFDKCLNNLRFSATVLRFHRKNSIWSFECNGNILLHIEANIEIMRTIKQNADNSSLYVVFFKCFFPSLCHMENQVVMSIVESYPMNSSADWLRYIRGYRLFVSFSIFLFFAACEIWRKKHHMRPTE